MNLSLIRQTWFSNIRGDLLAGIVVALALIPGLYFEGLSIRLKNVVFSMG